MAAFTKELQQMNQLLDRFASGEVMEPTWFLSNWLQFLIDLEAGLEGASAEEKREARQALSQMYDKLEKGMSSLASKSGMTEGQFYDYSENPDNYDQKSWQIIQGFKELIGQQSEKIAPLLNTKKKSA